MCSYLVDNLNQSPMSDIRYILNIFKELPLKGIKPIPDSQKCIPYINIRVLKSFGNIDLAKKTCYISQ